MRGRKRTELVSIHDCFRGLPVPGVLLLQLRLELLLVQCRPRSLLTSIGRWTHQWIDSSTHRLIHRPIRRSADLRIVRGR
eukprot:3199170-Pyramimonas_sp.AAC.2